MIDGITSIPLMSARQKVEDLKKQLEEAEVVKLQEEEREAALIAAAELKAKTPDEESARALVPERYREFVFPKRDKNNHQQWQHSVLCVKEFRESLVPHMDFLCTKSREWSARRSKHGFNATHVLTQGLYNGFKDIRNWQYFTDEDICHLIRQQ